MLLSDTSRGQRWLENFDLSERASATLLLDSLELVGQDDLRSGLTSLIESLGKVLPRPIALVPVRELAGGQSYYATGRDSKARMLLPTSFPGSESLVANILTGATRSVGSTKPFVAAPSLKNMRAARCRSILFVDDFSGSGGRIIGFHQAFKAHPTLRSWLSYHRIAYHVACFAATPKALRLLQRRFGADNVHLHRICPTMSDQGWEDEELKGVMRLCERYRSAAIQCHPLGWSDSRALLAFSHSVPNNLPVVLWQKFRAGHATWEPFFLDRGVPDDVRACFGETCEERRLSSALRRLRQTKLQRVDWTQLGSKQARDMMLVLAALARRPRDKNFVAQLTGLSLPEVRCAVDLCAGLNLVVRGLHLTDRGREELRHAKKLSLPGEITLNESDKPYYPRTLRAGR